MYAEIASIQDMGSWQMGYMRSVLELIFLAHADMGQDTY